MATIPKSPLSCTSACEESAQRARRKFCCCPRSEVTGGSDLFCGGVNACDRALNTVICVLFPESKRILAACWSLEIRSGFPFLLLSSIVWQRAVDCNAQSIGVGNWELPN